MERSVNFVSVEGEKETPRRCHARAQYFRDTLFVGRWVKKDGEMRFSVYICVWSSSGSRETWNSGENLEVAEAAEEEKCSVMNAGLSREFLGRDFPAMER